MTPGFLAFLPFVLQHEGGTFEDNPNDPGGATKWGIDAKDHPGVDIADLTQDQATSIYWQEWLEAGADTLPLIIGCVFFDEHVNAGPTPSTIHLQAALNTHPSLTDPAHVIAIDGILGPQTAAAAWQAQAQGDVAVVVKAQLDLRAARYRTLAQQPRLAGFLPGWLNRVADLGAWAAKTPSP